MGFYKEFFPVRVFPQGHGFFLIIIKVFSPRGVFPIGPAGRRLRKGHLPRQAPERKRRVFLNRFFPEQGAETDTDSTSTKEEIGFSQKNGGFS